MIETRNNAAVFDAALSPYRVAVRQDDGSHPYLAVECPTRGRHAIERGRPCRANLLGDGIRNLTVERLLVIVLSHDDGRLPIEWADRKRALGLALGEVAEYGLTAEQWSDDERPYLLLACPYVGARCPGAVDGQCGTNLIPEEQRGAVDFGTLVATATAHEEARYGVPIERLDAMRIGWEARRRTAVYIRETSDGASARVASVQADLFSMLLAELDQAVRGA